MTDVIIQNKDVIVEVVQPTAPPAAPPPKIGLVEINQVVQRGSAWMTGHGPPTMAGGQFGDMYLDMDTGDVYLWDGATWNFEGTFAPATLTADEILALLVTVDGPGSNLDADTLDGHDSTWFATDADLDANTAHDVVQDGLIAQNTTDINSNNSAIFDLQTANTAQDTAIAGKVAKAGDTMTGPLNVVTPPTAAAHAASKAYVDAQIGSVPAAIPPATANPLMDGTVAVGTATKYAREDHRHPSDTSKIGDAPNDGVQYVRQSLNWAPVVVPPGTVVSDTPPASPLQGQMWFKSSTGVLYTWYTDPNSSAWIQVSASPQVVDQNYTRKTARAPNRVDNPSAQLSQENGATAVTGAGGYPADQWATYFSGITASGQQVTLSTPTPEGTRSGVAITATTAKASLAAADYLLVLLPIEGVDIADFDWGTALAKPTVLRFCAVCDTVGTYGFSIGNGASDRSFGGSFTIAAAGVPQVFSFPIPGDTTGTWTVNNTTGAVIRFSYACGSTGTGVAGWQTGNKYAPAGCANGAAVANAKLTITDVGLHLDPEATGLAPPFEIEDYATTLFKCQRYWFALSASTLGYTTPGVNPGSRILIPVPMRIAPTASANTFGNSGAGATTIDNLFPNSFRYFATASVTGGFEIGVSTKLNARMI